MNRQCTDYVFGHETLVLQKQHRLIALYLFAPSSQELRCEHYKYGRGASSARRGSMTGNAGSHLFAVRLVSPHCGEEGEEHRFKPIGVSFISSPSPTT